jgi:hypothetical protein
MKLKCQVRGAKCRVCYNLSPDTSHMALDFG